MLITDPIPAHLASDFKYCRAIALAREEESLMRTRFAPGHLRPFLHVMFAFLWTARDFVDLPGRDDDMKLQLLDDWSRRLTQARSGQADHPVFRALAYTFEVALLPEHYLQNLLIAFRMDITNKRYETMDDLVEYCRFGANPLGRMVLHLSMEISWVAGMPDSDKARHSDALWTALQLTRFWQNLGLHSRSGQPSYLPKEEMDRFGVTEEMVAQRRFTPMLGSLMVYLVEETRLLLGNGVPLLAQVKWPLRLELATALERCMVTLDRIEENGGNTLRSRLVLSQRERLGCLWRAFGRASG
ncbi:MAG: squalene/phytoene synthase family protein [Magnetococcales bacterium]|nr:squalene/phytoene synthase family protein [Magnetococcales bacterium]